LAVPVFLLAVFAIVFVIGVGIRYRRRFAEAFESAFDATPGIEKLRDAVWDLCRGQLTSKRPGSDAEVGERFVATLSENLGQPGFRELILRTSDLDSGDVLPFVLLSEARRNAFV